MSSPNGLALSGDDRRRQVDPVHGHAARLSGGAMRAVPLASSGRVRRWPARRGGRRPVRRQHRRTSPRGTPTTSPAPARRNGPRARGAACQERL